MVDAISAGLLDPNVFIYLVDENKDLSNHNYESLVTQLNDTSEPPRIDNLSFHG